MHYKKTLKYLLLPLLLLLSCSYLHSGPHKILVLNSYHKNLSWSESTINGIEEGFEEHLSESYDLHIEFMDSKRVSNQRYINLFKQLIQTKYQHISPDIIIANDDNAMDFLLNHKNELFPNSPVVTTGINFSYNYPPEYTGFTEEIDFCTNFNLIQKLHPNTEHLYIIVDDTKTGKLIKRNIKEAIKRSNCNFDFRYLTNYTLYGLTKKLETFSLKDEHNVVFLTTFNKGKNGNYYSYSEIIENINEVTSLPVYAPWKFYLGKGIVGGKIIDGYDQGKLAAKLGSEILEKGKIPGETPIKPGKSRFQFDYTQLKHFNIALTDLPEEAAIINNPFDKVKENLNIIIFTASLILLLIIIIILLLRYNRIKKMRLTEQKNYLNQLEKTNKKLEAEKIKAEKANDLKSNFLAHISEEIKTPLNRICNYSNLLEKSSGTEVSTNQKNNYYNYIRLHSETLINLINNIIDLSKIETNQFYLNHSNFDLNHMLSELNEYVTKQIKESNKKNLSIKVEKGIQREKFFIRTDKERLKQVFINLLINAIKFSHFGSISFGYQIEGNTILFFVKDLSTGINKNETSYFMHKSLNSTKNNRTGVLFSKDIIKNMNGKIWIDSQNNNATIVYFTLPLIPTTKERHDSEKKSASGETGKKYNWEGKTILIVEDSRMACELIKKLLKGTNANFELETDGKSALERCKKDYSIDIVLMDIQLPIIDGYTVTKKIKEERSHLPIIAQTANAMSDDRKKAFEAGCDEYIAKPIDKNELAEKINKLLNK